MPDAPAARRGYVDTPEGQIHYREAGAGEPIVLLHQAPGSSSMWTALLEPLAALGHRVVAFDLPGYGLSDPPADQPDLPYYARRIAEAAGLLGLGTFDVFGHHTGASVALWLSLERPCPVRRIVGYGLGLLGPDLARELAEEEPPVVDEQGGDILWWWKAFYDLVPPEQRAVLVPRYLADMLLSGPQRPYGHRAVGRQDHTVVLSGVSIPLLALAGKRELLRRETEAAAALSPNITFHEFGDAGIFAADERPQELAAVVHEFLGASGSPA